MTDAISQTINWLIANAPLAVLPTIALYFIYMDTKRERETRTAQFDVMLQELTLMRVYIQTLAQALKIELPDPKEVIEGAAVDSRKRQKDALAEVRDRT